jgi:two-component system LytT family sensor kinase
MRDIVSNNRTKSLSGSQTVKSRKPTVGHQVAFLSILGFWVFYILIVTLRAAVLDFDAQDQMLFRRAGVTVFGILVTVGLYFIVRLVEHRPLSVRIIVACLAAVPCAFLISGCNYLLFNYYDPASLFDDSEMYEKANQIPPIAYILEVAVSRYFFIVSWAMLYLAISYASEVRAAERRAARFAQAAQQAELRSLRYQVNPHFLFNTLNSLSSLVMRNRPQEAESMIMNLSTFYRTSLTGDPLDDVPLSEEVKLQNLYLNIEAVRFPDRLKTVIDIPDSVMDCCVPGLILQPLVENAIKYGVSRATRPVTIHISAYERKNRLYITVSDNGDVIPEDEDKGNGIGLVNVRDRLDARFGEAAAIHWGPRDSGGFEVSLVMPAVRQSYLS